MSTIIDADPAQKLAGLQIDMLQKYRAGQITFDQIERFNNLSPEDREARFGDQKKQKPALPVEPAEKFAVLADLGIITVPNDYNHATRLATFLKMNRKKFYDVNKNITDANFSRPSRILKPGAKIRVRAFKQIVDGTTTSEERMAFLAAHKMAVYTGAQGASLVFEQKRGQLPKGYWYASFDEKDALPFLGGCHGVPRVDVYSGGGFNFGLGSFGSVWYGGSAFFGFSDE